MSEYVSVSIPEALARRARELARERRRSLDTVIAEVLDEALPPGETPEPADGEDEVVLREMQAYTCLLYTSRCV